MTKFNVSNREIYGQRNRKFPHLSNPVHDRTQAQSRTTNFHLVYYSGTADIVSSAAKLCALR
jgi:hypothetical protein